MLHMSVLPVHASFARLLSGLRFVVVDEGHAYRHALAPAPPTPPDTHTAARPLVRACSRWLTAACRQAGSPPMSALSSAPPARAMASWRTATLLADAPIP